MLLIENFALFEKWVVSERTVCTMGPLLITHPPPASEIFSAQNMGGASAINLSKIFQGVVLEMIRPRWRKGNSLTRLVGTCLGRGCVSVWDIVSSPKILPASIWFQQTCGLELFHAPLDARYSNFEKSSSIVHSRK